MSQIKFQPLRFAQDCTEKRGLKMQILDLFAANVPRYTSYPTAPHFHAGINQDVYRQWLAEIAIETPLSLYLHIPFCDTLCWFCGCHTTVVNNYAPVRDYCDLLLREIELVASALGSRRPVQHIHWGGGSPSMLRVAEIAQLDHALRDHFDVLPNAEFAVEMDPRGLTQQTVDAFARAGLTRASIGVQDCDPAVQKAINRIQTREETLAAVTMLRDAGVTSINLDLLYGLPNQTLESWEATLNFALELVPDRLAVFGYAHVPSFKKHQALIPTSLLPGMETRLRQAEMANEILCANAYVAVGLDHFARIGDAMAQAAMQGTLARNFQGYTTDKAPVLVGLGASAIGAVPQGYVQNLAAVPLYRSSVTKGQLPIQRGVALSHNDRIRRHVIERLMCDMEVDLGMVRRAFGENAGTFDDAIATLEPLAKAGLVLLQGETVSIPPEWRVAARLVCGAFDTYLTRDGVKHSTSV